MEAESSKNSNETWEPRILNWDPGSKTPKHSSETWDQEALVLLHHK